MYGYGYVTPFSFEYEANRLSCGIKDFDEALEEYSFLDNPDPETPVALLTYYTTKLNHAFKRKVSCIVSDLFSRRYQLFFLCHVLFGINVNEFWDYQLFPTTFWSFKNTFQKRGEGGVYQFNT
jgi:hypothetical protein